MLAWVLADIYFYRAVETLTNNEFILWAYWLLDLALVVVFASLIGQRKANRPPGNTIAWLMGATLLVFIPKILALPVLLLEDLTRVFRHFPPHSIWVSELALFIAVFVFVSLLYGMTGGRHRYKVHQFNLKI